MSKWIKSDIEKDELGGVAVHPDAAVSPVGVEPGTLQELYIYNSTFRILEVFLIVVAISAGVAVFYINRRNRERK